MTKILKVIIVAIGILIAGNTAQAQSKVAYVNLNALIDQMPEVKAIRTQIDAYSKQFMDQLSTMYNDYQAKGKAYQAQASTMTDAVRSAKEAELSNLQKRMNDYQTDSRQKVDAKTNELSKPIFDKVKATIALVAKEKGYTHVLDAAAIDLIVSPPGDDLMPAVKAKLGIK